MYLWLLPARLELLLRCWYDGRSVDPLPLSLILHQSRLLEAVVLQQGPCVDGVPDLEEHQIPSLKIEEMAHLLGGGGLPLPAFTGELISWKNEEIPIT